VTGASSILAGHQLIGVNMSIAIQMQQLIRDWSVDIYGGWSIMDLVFLFLALMGAVAVYNYFFFKAGS
jgi:hypothetical protein